MTEPIKLKCQCGNETDYGGLWSGGTMTGATIKHMVDRFLRWKLPADFSPDGGISFQKVSNAGTPHEYRYEPVGTNLLTATQAEDMLRHMLEGISPVFDADDLKELERMVPDLDAVLTHNPMHKVFFRAGLLACREYMARFVEQGGNPQIAASIRANWWPSLGDDPGVPRQLAFQELVDEVEHFPSKAIDPSVEALPRAWAFLEVADAQQRAPATIVGVAEHRARRGDGLAVAGGAGMIGEQFGRHLADVEGSDLAERAIAEPVDDRRQVAALAAVLEVAEGSGAEGAPGIAGNGK